MKLKTVDNWNKINKSLGVHKHIALGSLLLSLVLSIIVLVQGERKPIVVIDKGETRAYTTGDREGYRLSEEDVKGFIASYVKKRYSWAEFEPKEMVENLSCTTTEGFRAKLEKALGNIKHESGEAETVEQYAAFINPRLEGDRSFATFDRILRINGIPLATLGEISLDIVQGKRTDCNPVGLYVNGTTEYER